MSRYLLKRLGYVALMLVLLSLIIFFVYNLMPVDKAADMAMREISANKNLVYAERYLFWKRRLGLDGGILQRYLRWVGIAPYYDGSFQGLLQGNFGQSVTYGKPVIEVVKEPLKNTLFLNVFATAISLGITIPLGIFCGANKGSKRDLAVQVGTIIGYSLPVFIVAILFIRFLSVDLDIFPVSGMNTVGKNYTGIRAFWDKLYHFALPIIVTAFCSLGGMTRYVRAAMVDALSLDCVRTARAKGLKRRLVVYSHAWRNALIPVIPLVIGWLVSVFSGSIMIENIFGINGIGKVYFDALTSGDNEIVLIMQLFYILLALLGNLLVDVAYGIADPRVRIRK